MSGDELKRLVSQARLHDVRFFKVEGSFDVETTSDAVNEPGQDPVQIGMQMATRRDSAGLIGTMTCEMSRPGVHYSVEVAGLYDVVGWDDDAFSEEVIEAFGSRVVMFQLLPFAREAIADLATRLRLPVPILPLMPSDLGPGDLAQ